MEKTIYQKYEEVRFQEIKECINALKTVDNKYAFNRDDRPIVAVYLWNEPYDVYVNSVKYHNETVYLTVEPKDYSGEPTEINAHDVMYGHLDFVTSEIKSKV